MHNYSFNQYLHNETCRLVQMVFCSGGREQATIFKTRGATGSLYVFGMANSNRSSPRTGTTTRHAHSTTGLAPTMDTCQDQETAMQTGTTMSVRPVESPRRWSESPLLVRRAPRHLFFPFSTEVLGCTATTESSRPRPRGGSPRTAVGAFRAG